MHIFEYALYVHAESDNNKLFSEEQTNVLIYK